jgi:hypothetical protein
MLCERCHEREATVHLTRCNGDTGEMTKHDLCEPCATHPDGGAISPRALRGWKSCGPDTEQLDEFIERVYGSGGKA